MRRLFPYLILTLACMAVLWWSRFPHDLSVVEPAMEHAAHPEQFPAAVWRHEWVPVHVINWVSQFFRPGDSIFARLMTRYYGVFLLPYILAMYWLCRKFAGEWGSLVACLYLTVITPACWYDNFFQLHDSLGLLLSVWVVWSAHKNRIPVYLIALLVSGFVWEKVVMVPVCVGLRDYLATRRRPENFWHYGLPILVLGLFCAFIGPYLWSVWIPPDGVGLRLGFISHLRHQLLGYLGSWMIMFGPPVFALFAYWKRVPTLFKTLALQFIAFFLFYALSNAMLSEMRGIIVMATFSYPVLAMALEEKE